MFHKSSILDILPKVRGKYLLGEPLSKHTWFAVGGPAEVMYLPADIDDLSNFLKWRPYNLPLSVLGGGANLLVRDGGIPGVVIKLDAPAFKTIKIGEGQITLSAGLQNVELKKTLLKHELGGLEFLCSIPGTIGGSVKTNAGCFGKSIKDVLLSAEIIDGEGNVKEVLPQDFKLSYRESLFPEDWIITALTLQTEKTPKQDIQKILDSQKAYRQKNQPYNEKTAGSTFKNPEGLRAWELIKKAGCADLKIGGAKVSEKHCNFLINTGTATAEDLENLGNEIIRRVKEKTSLILEWEIKRIGVGK